MLPLPLPPTYVQVMQYMGGKERSAKHIAGYLESLRAPGQLYVEPFVGSASVISRMGTHGRRIGSDANGALITLLSSVSKGWEPPDYLTREEWERLRDKKDMDDPLTAFAGFGLSFGGKWFAGYAKPVPGKLCSKDGVSYSKTSLLKKCSRCRDVLWVHADYRNIDVNGALIYCDPPYAGTEAYAATSAWDPNAFWTWAEEQSRHNTVVVSEYAAPEGWSVVWERARRSNHNGLDSNSGGSVRRDSERIYRWCGPF